MRNKSEVKEVFSFSRLETFDQCPYKYKLKYIDKNYSQKSNIALEVGSLAHLGKEKWAECIINNQEPDLEYIMEIIYNGLEIEEIKSFNGEEEIETTDILGINELKNKYNDEYYKKCDKTGKDYDEKFNLYFENLKRKEIDDDWGIFAIEKEFKFKYRDYYIKGFIDRIDINSNGELRVVDYKTSKKIYDDKKIATPLQMFIYTLACEKMYNKTPVEHIYDFVFLDEQQKVCTKGYYNRGTKKLNKLLDKIEECKETGEFTPKPTPLCYWCEFCANSPLSDGELNHLCEYYSLWTPNNKTFAKNKEYKGKEHEEKVKRKVKNWGFNF